ncbi:hypothetical protein B0H11DRAFT_2287596 [Mycena galericulata]|nr:hypothetical protein B0H11DRAFT_2287596 [Mycena galericulata]
MFKRVEKRRRKQEEEEELGLDAEMKDVLGINDTDSEESESDSESDGEDAEGGGTEGEADEEEEEEESDDSSEDSDAAEEPPISVEEALRDPVYIVSLQPDVKACIVCPGKLLKSTEVLNTHRASKAHERRWRQFIAFAKSSDAEPSANAWDVLKLRAEQQPKLSLATPSTVSKRSEKREKQKAKVAARRAKKREAKMKAKAKAATSETAADDSAPAKKKRKVENASVEAVPESTELPKASKGPSRSPRNDRLERQGKLLAKLTSHVPPGARGKGNGKKKGPGGSNGKWKDDRGKRSKKDGKSNEKSKPLQIFD